jgi:hypothetical protein
MPISPWRPSRPVALLIGILTLLPAVYFVFFIALMFSMFSTVGSGAGKGPPIDMFRYVFPLHLGAMLLMFALMVIYIVHAFRTDRIAEDRRVLWVVVLFMGSLFAFPIYWYLYLWRPSSSAPPA